MFAGETLYFEEKSFPLAPYGKVEEYFLTHCYNPVRDETGGVGGVVVTLIDVSSEVRARAERDRALQEARAGRERLHEVFMQAPAAITVLEGPEHRFIVANPLFQELIGARNLIGKTVREALPETEEQGFIRLLDEVYRTRKAFTAQEMLIRLDRQASGALEDVYVDFVYQPLIGPDGASFGVMAHAVDVTEQVLARRKIEALAAERVAMLGHIADAVITMDAEGRVSFANAMAGHLYPGLTVDARVEDTVQLFRVEGGRTRLSSRPPPARCGANACSTRSGWRRGRAACCAGCRAARCRSTTRRAC